MKKQIPNIITLLNLAAGSAAIWFVFSGQPVAVMALFAVAVVADFADGFTARMLKVTSETGKQLDSFADLVSFGLLPAAMIFMLLSVTYGEMEGITTVLECSAVRPPAYNPAAVSGDTGPGLVAKIMLVSVLLVPVFAAWRLARFNLLPPSEFFAGLPTPAFAIFWTGIYYDISTTGTFFGENLSGWFIWSVMVITAVLMVIPLPMLSLKFSNFRIVPNFSRYLLITMAVIIFMFSGLTGLPLIILGYILLSLVRILLTIRR
jgi:CDP-diacylglycerol---serine O-phosphatidyltransferase